MSGKLGPFDPASDDQVGSMKCREVVVEYLLKLPKSKMSFANMSGPTPIPSPPAPVAIPIPSEDTIARKVSKVPKTSFSLRNVWRTSS